MQPQNILYMKTFLIILGVVYFIGTIVMWYSIKTAPLVPDDWDI